MSRRIESFFVAGPAGRLEALLEEPAEAPPREAVLVCHPHPFYGGTLHNKVVHRMARALRRSGCAVLRFNFRGVNLSQGVHDGGPGEVEDARACLAELRRRYPALPFTLAGFSFGARTVVSLAASLPGAGPGAGEAAAETAGPGRVIAAGFPTIYGELQDAVRLRRLRVFIQSTNDQYGPRPQFQAFYDRLWGPKQLIWIDARDHFFTGALDNFEDAVAALGLWNCGAPAPPRPGPST